MNLQLITRLQILYLQEVKNVVVTWKQSNSHLTMVLNVDLLGARAYYTINKGTAAEVHVEEAIDTIKASSSADYTFNAIPTFNEPGVNTIEVGLACDDNATNNVLTTTITITPAPHSFELSEGTNFPGYYNGGSMNNPRRNGSN